MNRPMQASDEHMKELYTHLQVVDAQIHSVQEQIEKIEDQIREISLIKEGLRQLSEKSEGIESYVPLASGIFVKATLAKQDHVLMNVGAGVCTKKTFDEAKELMDAQLKEVTSFRLEVLARLDELYKKADVLEKEAAAVTSPHV